MLYLNKLSFDKNFFYQQKDVKNKHNKYINDSINKLTDEQITFFDFFIFKKSLETIKKYMIKNNLLDMEDMEDITDSYELLILLLEYFGHLLDLKNIKIITEMYYDSNNKEMIYIYDNYNYMNIVKDTETFLKHCEINININDFYIENNSVIFFIKNLSIDF